MSKEYGWDSTLNKILRKHFQQWADSIPQYWNGPFKEDDIISREFHAFSNASEGGYGAVIYRRVKDKGGKVFVILVSRSHVVPLNAKKVSHHNSIVRLELVAALKTAQLKQFLESALGRKLPIVFFWFNSKPVIKQI